MPYDFKKLTSDVTAAMEKGREIAITTEDRGTCNMDGVILKLQRKRERDVVAALAEAGVNTNKRDWGWAGSGYMINPPWGQANKRSKSAEAIHQHLRQAGYSTIMWYQMD